MVGKGLARGGSFQEGSLVVVLQDLLSGTGSQLPGTPGCLGKPQLPAHVQPFKDLFL